jgi:hypothetical protein
MLREIFCGSRSLLGSSLLIVACGINTNEGGTGEPHGLNPVATGHVASATGLISVATGPIPVAAARGRVAPEAAPVAVPVRSSHEKRRSAVSAVPKTDDDARAAGFGGSQSGGTGAATLKPPFLGAATNTKDDGGGAVGATQVLALESCDIAAPFEAPVPAFTGSMDADGLTFSADGNTAYISGAGPGGRDIYVSTRSQGGSFSTPQLVAPINTQSIERAPSLSSDGKLYFTKQLSSGWLEIGRALGAPPFTAPGVVPAPISSQWQDEDPFWLGNNTLYFVSEVESQGAHRDIFRATWDGTTDTFSGRTNIANVNSTAEEFRPVLSADGLTLYFSSRRGGGIGNDTSGDIYMARRSSTGVDFPTTLPVNLWGLNTTGIDYPVTISANGCTLYFASNEETGLSDSPNFRLYQATRGISTPAQVTLRLNILGQGSVTQAPFNCGPNNTGTCAASAPPDTTMLVNASSQALWTGSCTGHGGPPSTDGVLTFSENAVCTIKFPGAPLVGAGGLCSLPMDCQQGLQCVNGTCAGGSCTADTSCQGGLVCLGEQCRPSGCAVDPFSTGCGLSGAPCGPCPNTCRNRTLELVDLQADFRDIWAGREEAQTGKHTEPFPVVTLEFNEPVVPSRLVARFAGRTEGTSDEPSDCHSTSGPVLHNVSLLTLTEADSTPSTRVTLKVDDRLRAGCAYSFLLDAYPANAAGNCLADGIKVDFTVVDDERTAFDREVGYRRFRPGATAPRAFDAAAGINTPAPEVFDRYADVLGLREGLDALVSDGTSKPSPLDADFDLTFFRQEYRDVPVEGFGYLVEHEDGIFRSGLGRVLNDLNLIVQPSVSSATAIDVALQHVNPASRPWQSSPPQADAPHAELLVAVREAGTYSPRLAWRVSFSGIPEASRVDIDAQSGAVLQEQPASVQAFACEGFDPDVATLSGTDIFAVTVPFDGDTVEERDDLAVGRWTQGQTVYQAFNSRSPFVHRTRYLDAPASGAPLHEYVCATDDPIAEQVGAVHRSLQAAERTFSTFLFGGSAWEGFSGVADESLLLATLINPPEPEVDALGFFTTGFVPAGSGLPDQILVRADHLFAPVIAHEFAHAVNHHSRRRAGLGPLGVHESGALSEAYGDIMAALTTTNEAPPVGVTPTCIPRVPGGIGCERDLANPKNSIPPHPDTYGSGQFWAHYDTNVPCSKENDWCGIHQNSTVASHWAYTLVVGRNGNVVNDHGCGSTVAPLGTPQEVGQLVFSSFALLPENAGFLTAREFTSSVARDLFGTEAEMNSERAWHAVGVGTPPRPTGVFPADGASGIDPWFAFVGWNVGDETGPWSVEFSKNEDFSDSIARIITQVAPGVPRHITFVEQQLEPGTRYYWRGGEGDALQMSGWKDCAAFVSAFTTSSKPIRLTHPSRTERDDYYQVGPQGLVGWEPVPFATGYQAALSESDVGCQDADWVAVPATVWSPEVALGDTLDTNLALQRDPVRLLPSVTLDEDHTYHLYIRARSGSVVAPCAHFEVRKAKLLPFQVVWPRDFGTIDYNSGGPFIWTPSEGATRYDIYIYQLQTSDTETVFEEIAHERVDLDEITMNNGNIEYLLHDSSATTLPRHMFWRVRASHPDSFTRFATDDTPEDFSLESDFFNGAQEITEGLTTMEGTTALGSFGETVLAESVHIPGQTNVTLVRHEGVGFDTETCFKVPGNTLGMLWWFGVPGDPVAPEDIRDTEVDPDSADEFSLCTGPLEITDDLMLLAVRPYAAKIVGSETIVGHGPEHDFYFTTKECGEVGEECCDESPSCSDAWTRCDAGICAPCGGDGDQCCVGDTSPQTTAICRHSRAGWVTDLNCGADLTCSSCGDVGERCCYDSTLPLVEGEWCDQWDSGIHHTVCADIDSSGEGTCRHCGTVNEPCCPTGCSGGLECSGDRCVGPTTPDTAKQCNQTVQAGGNEGGEFLIDVGRTNGRFLFEYNTIDVADRITLTYREGGPILDTLCHSTNEAPNLCVPDPGSGTIWCCDGAGLCSVEVPFRGSSSFIKATVFANCAGGVDTEWSFKVGCAKN